MSYTTARTADGPDRWRARPMDERLAYIEDAAEAGSFAGGASVQVSAGTLSQNLTRIVFGNSNGVTFGLSASTITASVNAGGGGVALGAGTQTATSGTVSFANSNGVTFGMSGSNQITASHNGLTNVRAIAGTESNNLSVLSFANGNGVTFGLNSTVLTASHNGLTSQSAQAFSAANGSATFQTLSFANSNGVSFSTGTQGLFASYTVPSTAGLLSAINLSAGTTSQNLSNVVFSNGGNVSFGLNGSTVTASAPAGGGGATVSLWPALPHAWATSSMYTGASTTVGGGSSSTLSFYVSPLVLPVAVTFNGVGAIVSAGTAAGTGSGTHRHVLGIYTRNASTLNLVTGFAFNAVHSASSSTAHTLSFWAGAFSGSTAASTSRISGNVSASITGLRGLELNASSSGTSLSAGEYFIAHAYNYRSSSAAVMSMGSAWRHSVSQFTGAIGFSNTSSPLYCYCNGIVSTVVTAPTQFAFDAPSSISLGAITATGGTSQNQWPLVILRSVTA